jgi:copper chaperone
MSDLTYTVPGMSCGHCTQAVGAERRVAGVASVDVELDTKQVVVRGERLNDAAIRAAIVEAGYEAA